MTMPGFRFPLLTGLLLVSLALNILGLGVWIGHRGSHHGPEGGLMGDPHAGMLAHMERALNPEDAKIFDQQMRQTLPPSNDAQIEMDFKAVKAALQAKDFSPAAFKQAVQQTHERRDAMDKDFVQALTTAVTKISADGRQRLANELPMHPPRIEDGPPPPPDGMH